MSSVGSHLRGLRERRGVSLDEIARSTRVLHPHLEALEADNFVALPAPAFTRGFIRAYCQALGERPDEALALYEAGRPERVGPRAAHGSDVALPESRARAEPGTPQENRPRGVVLVSFVLLVVLGAALFAVTLALQPAGERRVEAPTPPPTVEAPAPEAPTSRVTHEALPTGPSSERPSTPTASGAPPALSAATAPAGTTDVASTYRLVARTSELTWMRVSMEDGRVSEENIPAGEVREWVSNRPFVLSIGNAGGVTLELNGQRLPPLGRSGAVIARLVLPSEGQ
jgi:cytoskeletal protein RodZ